MSILRHLFVALLYALIATAVAVVLPFLMPSIGLPVALIAGAVVLVGFGLMHESFARQDDHRRLADRSSSRACGMVLALTGWMRRRGEFKSIAPDETRSFGPMSHLAPRV